MSKKNNSTVAMLLKSEVRTLNEVGMAGCERVFVDDASYLKKIKKLENIYAAIGEKQSFNKNSMVINHIYYPHNLIDKIAKTVPYVPIVKRLTKTINKSIILITQFYYAVNFVLKERKTQFYYVVQTPLVALFYPKKTTTIFHNFYYDWEYIFSLLYFFRRKKTDVKLVFVSNNLLQQYLQHYPALKKSRHYVLHNAVDTKTFYPIKKNYNKITFVFLSAWVRVKGVYMLPKIIKEINKEHQEKVSFVIGGATNLWSLPSDDYKKYNNIKQQIKHLPRQFPNVKIVGLLNRTQVASLLKSATFCLLPSTWPEPNSLLVNESLACGTPVIAFDVGGNKEIITDKENGHLVKTVSRAAMIKRIKSIIKGFNQLEYKKLSTTAKKSALKHSPQARAHRLQQIIFS